MRNKHNTPVIIKYPFWQMTFQDPQAPCAGVTGSAAACPGEFERQSICIRGDIGDVLHALPG